jgi:hypothetical protein
MAARLSHASATPNTLDLILQEMSVTEDCPTQDHRTDYGVILRYVIGVRIRKASLEFLLTTPAEHDNFWTFYRTATNANTRFTFTADNINYPSDTWSAFFVSTPKFERRKMPGARILGTLRVDIQDAPVTL